MRVFKKHEVFAMVAMALVSSVMSVQAADPIGKDDMVLGINTGTSDTGANAYKNRNEWTRWYDASTGTWSSGPGSNSSEPTYLAGGNASWDVPYLQAMEFDNASGKLHNASGNLLGATFGNSYSGFTIYGLSTNGSDDVTTDYAATNGEGLFSIKKATTGTVGAGAAGSTVTVTKTGGLTTSFNQTERAVGLSVSMRNTKVAMAGYDSGAIFVLDYNAGTNPGIVTVAGNVGTLAGASISGPRITARGDFNGNAGSNTAIRSGTSTGSTWLNDNTVMVFDGYGRMILWDVTNVQAGNMNGSVNGVTVSGTSTAFTPNIDAGWKKVGGLSATQNYQYTDVEYNPMINPNIIVSAATKNSTYTGVLYLWNFDPITGAVSLNTTLTLPTNYEPREIAFDSQGNLLISNYNDPSKGITNFVTKLAGASNAANWTLDNLTVFRSETSTSEGSFYTAYNGIDVASDLIDVRAYGDYNNDKMVDTADYTVWADAFGQAGYFMWADGNADGIVDTADYTVWADHFGVDISKLFTTSSSSEALSGSNIPEPTSIGLLAITAAGLLIRRRQA